MAERKQFTIWNHYHQTSTTVHADETLIPGWWKISKEQAKAIRRSLCHKPNCNCGAGPAAALCGDSDLNPKYIQHNDGSGIFVEAINATEEEKNAKLF